MAISIGQIDDNLRELGFKTVNNLYQLARVFSGVPSNFTVGITNGTVFTLTEGEKGFVQNVATVGLAVKYGVSATSVSLNLILAGGTAVDDGKGEKLIIRDEIGDFSVSSMTAQAPRYLSWKQAT